jgi:hypothetical protein
MASTRTRLDASALQLGADMVFTDVWADTSITGVTAKSPINLRYTGNANPADDLATQVPSNGIINYPEHIQPLWTRDRGALTCISCHKVGTRLDLEPTVAGTGRLTSYETLMKGDPVIDPATGLPQIRLREGVPEVARQPALVEASASEGEVIGIARKSRLMEILTGQLLMASSGARAAHPASAASAPNHAIALNAAEKRLLAEWMDLGGKFYNDPFDAAAKVRSISQLDLPSFTAKVLPVLRSTCASNCHMAVGSDKAGDFRNNRFVLTGNAEGDYNVTLSMINDTCNAASNPLLARPSTVPHPAGASKQTTAVLPVGSANYNAIAAWITTGCPGN